MTKTELIFKQNIKKLRKQKPGCLNKSETAKGIGLSVSYYISLEDLNISKVPSFLTIEKIAQYHNIEVWELFKEKFKEN